MYQVELNKVKSIKQKYNETLSVPTEEDEINKFSEEYVIQFNSVPPIEYLEFLRQCNGLEFNGCIVYGSRNFMEAQLDYEFLTDKYIIFAEYDIGWFCMEKYSGQFYELDKPTGQKVRTFISLEKMFKYLLVLSTEL